MVCSVTDEEIDILFILYFVDTLQAFPLDTAGISHQYHTFYIYFL